MDKMRSVRKATVDQFALALLVLRAIHVQPCQVSVSRIHVDKMLTARKIMECQFALAHPVLLVIL